MKKEDKNKIVLFFGGKSVEREVSIITANQVMKNFNPFKEKIFPVYISENGEWFFGRELEEISFFKKPNLKALKKVCLLPNCKILFEIKNKKLKPITDVDCVINCCHGAGGENGELSGVVATSGVPFASPDVLASSLLMDKFASKMFFKGLGLSVLECELLSKAEFEKDFSVAAEKCKKIGFPVAIKPRNLGSSVGVSVCENEEELKTALELAFSFDNFVIIEKGLKNFEEFFCSAFGNQNQVEISEIERTKTAKIFDFDQKYLKSGKREFPAKISKALKEQIKFSTKKIFESLKCVGVIRIDFLFDKKNKSLFVNEANTVPGSLAIGFWRDKTSVTDFLEKLIENAKNQHEMCQNLEFNFKSTILENFEAGEKTKLK